MTRMMRTLVCVVVLPLSACLDPTIEEVPSSPAGTGGTIPCRIVAEEDAPQARTTTSGTLTDATFELSAKSDCGPEDLVDLEDLGIDDPPAKFVNRSQGRRFLPPP